MVCPESHSWDYFFVCVCASRRASPPSLLSLADASFPAGRGEGKFLSPTCENMNHSSPFLSPTDSVSAFRTLIAWHCINQERGGFL